MKKNEDLFFENTMYHVYNRTNNKEPLFKSDENRNFFLQRYKEIIHPFLRTYSYTLQPNHFHFLISVRKESEILEHLKTIPKEQLLKKELMYLEHPSEEMMNTLISSCFQRFFTSYSMAFNKQHTRKGNLFYKRFQRKQVRIRIIFRLWFITFMPIVENMESKLILRIIYGVHFSQCFLKNQLCLNGNLCWIGLEGWNVLRISWL